MRRRSFLATAALAAATTAGCTAGYSSTDSGATTGEGTPGVETVPLAELGVPPDVCEEDLQPEGFLAIDEPAFGPPDAWPEDPDGYRPLTGDTTVIGLTNGNRARAYPLNAFTVHEIVNDDFGGPVIVTYCPLCRSGMVADRTVDGTPAIFDVSGLLWKPPRIQSAASEDAGRVFSDRERGVGNNGNLVMYDSVTGSYWSQMLAKAICGPQTGEELTIRPSAVASLDEWMTEHPDSEVLLPAPQSGVVDPPVTE